jgi:hypothetical protein
MVTTRWFIAVSLMVFGVSIFLARHALDNQLGGHFPSWPSLVIAAAGLLAAIALQPMVFAVPLILAALWLVRPSKWAGIPWHLRHSE